MLINSNHLDLQSKIDRLQEQIRIAYDDMHKFSYELFGIWLHQGNHGKLFE
jgi:hypothetical protein